MNECGYCSTEGWRKNEIQNDWLKIQVVPEGKMYLWYEAYSTDSSFELEVDINYCPMCGRKLECQAK